MVQTAASRMTEAEYVQYELQSERRHEYINGDLFEMPGEKGKNNRLAGNFYRLLIQLLDQLGYAVYINDVKVAIPGGDKYRYPDVFATKEAETEESEYIKREPAIVVEVVSPGSRMTDYADKFLEYTEIPSLEYYLIAEPEEAHVTVYERDADYWIARKYASLDDTIQLSKLAIALPMRDIYARILS